ncbi:Helix-turn-helix [Filomicrobium insigne]|uniref:Helix-turn-helix n=1 Tax=Filomicrobium insigne TaxID=418854 RepID=A0A1H0SIE4_9HYPH|nr:Helix-turn-helix [Filomicrobium insigne]
MVLKLARAGMGWSQVDLAKVARLSPRTLRGIENGEVDPRCSTFEKLRNVLKHHHVAIWKDDNGRLGVVVGRS